MLRDPKHVFTFDPGVPMEDYDTYELMDYLEAAHVPLQIMQSGRGLKRRLEQLVHHNPWDDTSASKYYYLNGAANVNNTYLKAIAVAHRAHETGQPGPIFFRHLKSTAYYDWVLKIIANNSLDQLALQDQMEFKEELSLITDKPGRERPGPERPKNKEPKVKVNLFPIEDVAYEGSDDETDGDGDKAKAKPRPKPKPKPAPLPLPPPPSPPPPPPPVSLPPPIPPKRKRPSDKSESESSSSNSDSSTKKSSSSSSSSSGSPKASFCRNIGGVGKGIRNDE